MSGDAPVTVTFSASAPTLELQVERDGLRRAEVELALLILKPVDVRGDLVMPGRERRRDVLRPRRR